MVKSGGIVIYKFTPFIYEAAYIALNTGFFEYENDLSETIKTALHRIFHSAGIENSHEAQVFLENNSCIQYETDAMALLNRIHIKEEFFSSLDEASAHIYHSMNFEVSAEYGVNIARAINFSNKKVADIGGSSGGLLWGIKQVYPGIEATVFDKEYACSAGEILTDKIYFERFDFFTDFLDQKKFDYIILSNILHDWSDEDCALILKNTVKNMSSKQKLIIHEDILNDDGLTPMQTLMYGLRLSINVFAARQRTISQIMELVTAVNPQAKLSAFKPFDTLSAMVIEF